MHEWKVVPKYFTNYMQLIQGIINKNDSGIIMTKPNVFLLYTMKKCTE